jgi:hypothetical protein
MTELLDLTRTPSALPEDAAFSAFLIYEDVATGVRAKQTAEVIAEELGCRLQLHLWNAEVLGISSVGDTVMEDADAAEIVIISVRRALPPRLLRWVRRWLESQIQGRGALLAIFEDPTDVEAIRARDTLRAEAERAGLEFFSEEVNSSETPAEPQVLFWLM